LTELIIRDNFIVVADPKIVTTFYNIKN